MDDTQTSTVTDAAAAATRKRRSSILKSQRPPRTPFSELEFNVATPTDTTKSRRVSFSRRTGVAEFATNEATTTWKNFYEEHNRSLEISGSEAADKQIGHIGKRIFDQQFEEVEADFVGMNDPGHMNKSLSLNIFNHQPLSLDRTEELKLSGHHSIMNLSTFTNTNLFGEPAIPGGEVTDRIDINFSNIQPIGNDDLDDMQNDLKQNFQSAFKSQNVSEYIELDLNTTQAALCNDDMSITETIHSPEVRVPINVENSDGNVKSRRNNDLDDIQNLNKKYGHEMSLSQSINSLKVLDPKTKLIDGNCGIDKENIAINPYAPLKETENFAVNEEVDKVLVFDGKRLTLQAEKAQDKPQLPKPTENSQRKTIVLNLHDDLPNLADDSIVNTTGLMEMTQLKKNLVLDDLSITETVLDSNKRTFIFDKEQGNISITQGVATDIVSEDKSRTIHYDEDQGNISITQVLPTKINEKRRTIVYDNEEGNISITTDGLGTDDQNAKRKTLLLNDGDISITKAISSNIVPEKTKHSIFVEDTQGFSNISSNEAQKQTTEKGRTIFYEDDYCNFSMAQAIPSNISITGKQSSDRRRTLVCDADTGDISITQVVPSVIIQEKNKETKTVPAENKIMESQSEKLKRTILYDNDKDLSITLSVPNHILKTNHQGYASQKCLSTEGASNEVVNTANRKTIVFEEDADISMTQAVSRNQVLYATKNENKDQTTKTEGTCNEATYTANRDPNKRKTIVFGNDNADISLTQAVSLNQVLCAMRDENEHQTTKAASLSDEASNVANSETNRRKTIVFSNDDADISITQAVSLNRVLCAMRDENKDQATKIEGASKKVTNVANSDNNKRKTIVFDKDEADISMTQAVSVNQVLCAMRDENKNQTTKTEGASKKVTNIANSDNNKRKTIVFDDDEADISMTLAVSVNQVLCAMRDENKNQTTKTEGASKEITNTANSDNNKRKTIVFDDDEADISLTESVSVNQVLCTMRDENKNQTTETKSANNEVTNAANCHTNKRKTLIFGNDDGDISMTQAVSLNQVLCAIRDENKHQTTKTAGASSEVTNAGNSETNRRKTIVFDDDEADISMTQAVSENQVLSAMRDKNQDQTTNIENRNCPKSDVKKPIVLDDISADISIIHTVPTNIIECFNMSINEIKNKASNNNNCDKRQTNVFDHDEGDISMSQVGNTETIVQKQNERNEQDARNVHEEFVLEAVHNKKGKIHRTIVYEKEADSLSGSLNQKPEMKHATSINMKGNILERRNTVIGDVNPAVDNLAEMLEKIQNNYENKQSNDQATPEKLNVPKIHTPKPDNNLSSDVEKLFDMSSRKEIQKVIKKALTPEEQSMSSRTNLTPLTGIQNDFDKSIRDEICNVIREHYNESVVFQTALSVLTDKGDSKSANFDSTFSEHLSLSSKANNDYKSKPTEKVSSEKNPTEINPNEINPNEINPNEINPNEINPNEINTNEINPNEIKNIEQLNENKSLGKIPNDNASISRDSEKASVKSKSILNDLLDMSSSNSETHHGGHPDGENNKKNVANDSDEAMFVITHDQKETKIQTDTSDHMIQLIVQSPLPLEYISKDNSTNEPLPLTQKIHHRLQNIKEVLVKSTNKTFDKIRSPILKGKCKEDKSKLSLVTIKGPLALENKCEVGTEPQQSLSLTRRSIVISREDMLNNISMAEAVLKTRIEFDDEDLEDSPDQENSPNNIRMSNDVVKTLQFDDSITETNLFKKLSSPLQKAAFGETSYVRDTKSYVIPQFTNVSDGIKELMDDLVKPNSDVLPFDCTLADKPTTKKPSTHSTQIQANLVTSSQVELLGPVSESICNPNMNRISSIDIIKEAVNRSVTRALKSPIKPFTADVSSDLSEPDNIKRSVGTTRPAKRIESPVLMFDHYNPLNNILLSPKPLHEAHTYNPFPSKDDNVSERSISAQISLRDTDVESTENVTLQYHVSNVSHCVKQSGDSKFNRSKAPAVLELPSKLSLLSKPPSTDRSTDVDYEKDLKSAEVNTLIAMKGNLELLEDHSSLTLVDDALAQSSLDEGVKSAMKVLYSSYTDDVLCDELTSNEVIRKSKKRVRDQHKPSHDRRSIDRSKNEIDVTPKPNKKIQKLSQSPCSMKPTEVQLGSEKIDDVSMLPNTYAYLTQYKLKSINPLSIHKDIVQAMNSSKSGLSSLEPLQTASQSYTDSSEVESSCTSSKNLRDDMSQVDSNSSKVSRMDWQPDDLGNEMRVFQSGANVVREIEKLPFMGRECEWESRATDMWSFRLLHGRIRLMLRLEQRNDATRAVQRINVEVLQQESKNTLASLCVRFAADTMQWFVNRGCSTESEVPTLVRRCAAAARLAARWGRLMNEARHYLAYSLTPYGLVTLKVANIPLRCVWEVTLQLRLAQTSGSAAPWVQATDVTVRRVLSCAPPRTNDDPASILRRLPDDWSHAPRAIWKIFKYLKHMTREEDDELFRA